MKVVILAGGYGTRISEESHLKPKPMIEIGDKPILWHIMKIYSSYGFNDFIICCGFKQYVIKEYFANYFRHNCDMTVDISNNSIEILDNHSENWKVTMVDTGLDTMTGGRIKRVQKYIHNEPFMLTYGDGVADINIKNLLEFHCSHGKLVTITAVNPGQRFGVIEMDDVNSIHSFREKSNSDGTVINGGFMVLQPEIFNYITDDNTIFEQYPLEKMAEIDELKGFLHQGFWHCMDTQRDKQNLENLWQSGKAPWKVW
jgi:glucose-1-phosphate cytidylyltransferase